MALGCAGALLAGGGSGCGGANVERGLGEARERAEQIGQDVAERVKRAREQFEESRRRFGERIEEVLAELEPLFQRPERTSPQVRSRAGWTSRRRSRRS